MIIIPTLHTKQLRINIEDQRLVIYDDENPPTVMYNVGDAEYPKLFITDPDETDPENRISMVPSLLRIVQYETNEQKVFISSAYRVVLNSVEEEDRIVAVLNSEFNRKRQADMNETYGKVSHYTHTWEQDDYASFHFVEREGQDGSRTLFVIGIGTHIDEEIKEDYVFKDGHWTSALRDVFSKDPIKPLCIEEENNRLCTFLTAKAQRTYKNKIKNKNKNKKR